jgi:hypothetical protein
LTYKGKMIVEYPTPARTDGLAGLVFRRAHWLRHSLSAPRLSGVRLGWKQDVLGNESFLGPLAQASEADPFSFFYLVEHLDELEVGPGPRLL